MFKADEKLISTFEEAFYKTDFSKSHKIQKGTIASGDQFISDSKKKSFIIENFHPECVEMEGTAIAQTCYKNQVPFVIIRCMSDCADDNVQSVYDEETAAGLSSKFLLEAVSKM